MNFKVVLCFSAVSEAAQSPSRTSARLGGLKRLTCLGLGVVVGRDLRKDTMEGRMLLLPRKVADATNLPKA
jgi:hypothetical protein